MRKRAGGKASPYDHSEVDEADLSDSFASAVRMAENEPNDALTPMRITAMEALVKLGVPIPTAAASLKCGRVVGRWARKARSDSERGIPPGFGDGQSPHVLWLETMDAARAYSEASLVSAIAMAAPSDWKAAAYILERRYTKRWNLTSKLEISAEAGKKLEISSYSTAKLLDLARGLIPEDQIKEVRALPADVSDAELLDDDVRAGEE